MSTPKLLASLFAYKAWANEDLFTSLKTLDETKHQTERHAAIRVLNHIYIVDRVFEANLQRKRHDYKATNTPETPTLEELHEAVRTTDRWYLEYIPTLSLEDLSEELEFAFVDGALARMSREEMLAHVVTHGGYHRGAVGRIVAQLPIAPPRDTYTLFLHTSEPARRERVAAATQFSTTNPV